MFRIAKSKDALRKVLAVRAIVFCEEQSVPYAMELDEYEDSAVHILGEQNAEPIAAGRLRFIGQYAKIERLAVRKAYRRKGYGSALLEFILSAARQQGFYTFKLHAQVESESFYAKQGFMSEGDEFLEADILHRLMIKQDND